MLVQLKNVNKNFKSMQNIVFSLNSINLEADKGEIVTILGPSGSGKSTLLNIIGGIDRADSGSIIIEGVDLNKLNDKEITKYRRNNIGYIFQFYNLIPNLNIYENIEVSTNISENPLKIEEVLDGVGMLDKRNKFPQELSGGEQQRVSIARAIAKNPKILLCDEPTGALDYKTAKEILNLLEYVNSKYKTTIFIVTHNTAISRMSDRIIRLRSGEIVENIKNNNKISAKGVEW
ncbi:putative ABC transport system ATP-binding protein [Caloramator quimbayensis]|uniref:Putative ABC transport system ATP-binding protein n=1 Tax=Caloramator quimbayensis TaxID=1147123 RepID=A0A1T4WQ34_9CLOT|nr:ABC transporter ATP-binding protein [Caloramator quimbayensis]SKA79482.1 putative ABC transport system ATP-binding protein [Caloramator quimbayensis]